MAENAEKKVVIALNDYLKSNPKIEETKYAIALKYGLNHTTIRHWNEKAPDVVDVLFRIVAENPKTNIAKALNEWKKPPQVLAFLRDFMRDYKAEFLDLVKEV
jgi:hypothetical protein